ncbi:hypothetical protein [Roseateles paludis]|jgi:hypothetical protein|uniref:Uncharacterized protein n=1 Tax=Roseateles paludis TaxID=3145238 RepID=A0ABV0FX35_9BURK
MTDLQHNHSPDPMPDAFDALLRTQLHAEPEPLDAGFSLRVMAALPTQTPRRFAPPPALGRWLRIAQWSATSTAAAGLSAVFASPTLQADPARALAGACLLGLVVFWSIPSRWSGS